MRKTFTLALLLIFSSASADTLADLKRTLHSLDGRDQINAKLSFAHLQVNGSDEGKARPAVTVGADVAADAAGVRMHFSRRALDLAVAESRQTDPEAKKPVSDALAQILVTDVDEYLSAAPKLLAQLQRAELLEEKPDAYRGKPARLLSLKLNPLLSKQQRKYVKQLDAHARVWVSPDGAPLAAEQTFEYAGRALLVINFESSTTESFQFQRRNDRLVVVRHQREESSSGGGESGTRTIDARLTLSPAAASAQAGAK